MNTLTLKWGTVKAFNLESQEAIDALQKRADYGESMSAALHEDTPDQQQALIDALEFMDEIWLDWDGKMVTREEAKEYILGFGKKS
jgi:hypothetical protein